MVQLEQLMEMAYNGQPMSTKLPDIDLAALCKDVRDACQFTQTTMAKLLDVTLTAYQRYEAGDRIPNGEATAKLFLMREELQRKGKKIPLQFIFFDRDKE